MLRNRLMRDASQGGKSCTLQGPQMPEALCRKTMTDCYFQSDLQTHNLRTNSFNLSGYLLVALTLQSKLNSTQTPHKMVNENKKFRKEITQTANKHMK